MAREEHNTIGENMQRARVAAGLSQQQFAVKLGVAVATASRWETGKNVPPVPTLRRIAAALDVTLAALVEEGST